jgi:RNA polymerase sigma-70 factor (ECF subfamily)
MRRLVDLLRSPAARRGVPAAWLPNQPDTAAPSAEELVLLGVQHGDLGPALSGLSPELRAVVQATVLDGLTAREAARLLDLPVGTVKTRLRRAKAQLREQLA